MYNGDSFGFLFDTPVTGGPYRFLSDPQYVGTTMAALGSSIAYRSVNGFVLAIVIGFTFYLSVKFVEGPHLRRIYRNAKSKQTTSSNKNKASPKRATD